MFKICAPKYQKDLGQLQILNILLILKPLRKNEKQVCSQIDIQRQIANSSDS